MSRIDDLIAEHCPDGVPRAPLGEIGTFLRGKRFVKSDLVEDGVPCIHYGELYTSYGTWATAAHSYLNSETARSLRTAKPGDLVIVSAGETVDDVCKAVAWLGASEVVIHDACFAFTHSLDPKYAAYVFQTRDVKRQVRPAVARSKVVSILAPALERITIPVPPMVIQREIVSILDRMEALQAELEAELQARSRQYVFYRDSLLALAECDGVRWAPLSEIAEVRTGQAPPDGLLVDRSDFPYVNAGTTASGCASRANTGGDAITIPSRGQGGVGIVGYQAGDFWCGPLCYRIRSNLAEVSTRYVYYFLKSNQDSIRGLQQTGGTPALNRKELVLVKIAVPPLHEQERIVAILDRFDAMVNDLAVGLPAEIRARRQQFEHYRDRLLTFSKKAV